MEVSAAVGRQLALELTALAVVAAAELEVAVAVQSLELSEVVAAAVVRRIKEGTCLVH